MFLLVAHKPYSYEYSHGCRIGGYESDLQIRNNLTAESLTEELTDYLLKNLKKDFQEENYDFYIFKNGIQVWSGNCFSYYERMPDTRDDGEMNAFFEQSGKEIYADAEEMEKIFNTAKAEADKKLKMEKEEIARQINLKTLEAIKEKEDSERKMYEQLKKKFESS